MNFLTLPGAPCQGATHLFFPEGSGGGSNQWAYAAKKVCRTCPHILPCRQYAVDNNEAFGIWGGMTEKERRRWRYEQRRLNVIGVAA